MIAARLPEQYVSVSAFAPIANPINCPWGQKAFAAYLGMIERRGHNTTVWNC